ncbi:hypothetical protein BFJ66_g15252 [Fusarium oxysporum f. sp. cepae]|nr:hypothetical protein BFJ66_g15252 [Fusarium oxysporum f. sp. cepae]
MDASDSEQTVYGLPGGRQEAQKRLTVSFHDVGIDVHGLGEDFASTFISVITDWIPFKGHTSKRSILQGISGQVCPGEMLLVLGRPGSGCTSLLKVIANHVHEFPVVSGQVRYGNIGPHQAKEFRQHIVMNTEGWNKQVKQNSGGHLLTYTRGRTLSNSHRRTDYRLRHFHQASWNAAGTSTRQGCVCLTNNQRDPLIPRHHPYQGHDGWQ